MGRRQADFAIFAADCACGPISSACGDSNCMDPIPQERIDVVTEVGDQLTETYRDSLSLAEMADKLKRCEERLSVLESKNQQNWMFTEKSLMQCILTAFGVTIVLAIIAWVLVIALMRGGIVT